MAVFQSFLQAGFECSTHRNAHGARLDVVAATRHDEFAIEDYSRLQSLNIRTVREGARWHLIEARPGRYDFSSLARIYDAAQATGAEIILDLLHFGWPDRLDITRHEFIDSFTEFTGAALNFLQGRGVARPFIIPVNEISFLSWAAGDQALIGPYLRGMGGLVKRQLVRAAIQASKLIRVDLPQARLLSAEPVIHIFGRDDIPGDRLAAERHRLGMFEAWDMLTGVTCPELGGSPDLLDMLGINYYDRNQWINGGETLSRSDERYRPFHKIVAEIYDRYKKPLFISETGTEDDDRPAWFEYVADEVQIARRGGIPVEGLCLYPIVNHPGWDDGRRCANGLWDYADDRGSRDLFTPLAIALLREQERLLRVVDARLPFSCHA